MKKSLFTIILLLAACVSSAQKREFRGAWMQVINGQYNGLSTSAMQQRLAHQLDVLQADGVNAIIFQVRPECDALYASSIEPWSRFLTGRQGQPPTPYWDPLQWMVEQCHKRGMELHAWINPYRARIASTREMAPDHIAVQHPERAFAYAGQLILNPALRENRDYICRVADDIVSRYDVDGLHIDDYFYPYPNGQDIPDQSYYKADPRGFNSIGDWRRDNVNLFVKQLYETVHARKPWVKVGISPFGIYRNLRTDPKNGSATNGLQNYDDLYADVLLWINNGWLDYCAPQLYWEIGNKAADYATLIKWWNRFAANRPLFIGESIENTVRHAAPDNPNSNQMPAKHRLHQSMPNVGGTVLWYGDAAVRDLGNYGTVLRTNYWRHPALQPLMPFIDHKAPKKPRKVKVILTDDGPVLFWTAPKGKKWGDIAVKYVVYRFDKGERINLGDASKIVTVTPNTFYRLPVAGNGATYAVTALDRLSNESKAKRVRVK